MKFYLRRIRLNQGGYNRFGEYFGSGDPLYYYESEDCAESDYIRAYNREDAKAWIAKRHPGATFFN